MSGRRSRNKGAAFERLLANIFKPFRPNARRGGQGQSYAATACCDVEGTEFWIEAKHQKNPSILAAYRQAKEATDGRPPLIITKRTREDILVTMKLEDWLKLWEKDEDHQK